MIALARVDGRGAHAARLLAHATPAERELVLGVLRWQLTLDHLLARHLHQPLSVLDERIRAALRVGLYEARRMRTPAPVAVMEAVRVAKALAPRAAGLVNAVLRRTIEEPWPDPHDPDVPLPLRLSHPEWLVQRWVALLGGSEAAAALAADQEPAPLCLLAAVTVREQLAAAGCEVDSHPLVPGVLVVTNGAEVAVAALRAGKAYAIDPAAVAVARLLPEAAGLTADLTAAPGGKSLVLASERPGIRLFAADRSLRRTLPHAGHPGARGKGAGRRRRRRPRRTAETGQLPGGASGRPVLGHRYAPPPPGDPLAPAACGSGRARSRSARLAEAASALLAPGGVLLYATCSLEPEENAAVVAGLDLEVLPVAPALLFRALPSGGAVIPPGVAGDGFTVHLLRRRA